MKIQWHYNKWEHEWGFSEDGGLNLWIISRLYDRQKFPSTGGYKVTFCHLQNREWYGNPTPIFICRTLKESKLFVELCVRSTKESADVYKYTKAGDSYDISFD